MTDWDRLPAEARVEHAIASVMARRRRVTAMMTAVTTADYYCWPLPLQLMAATAVVVVAVVAVVAVAAKVAVAAAVVLPADA